MDATHETAAPAVSPEELARADARIRCAMLTPAQRDALILRCKGAAKKEVSTRLDITVPMVGHLMTKAFAVLEVNSIAEAAVIAAKAGIV